MLEKPIRVLICDDSAVVRQFLTRALQGVPGIEICGRASDGEEAVRQVRLLHPDVVTMDVEMPKVDGITAVRRIMAETPVPILMISSLTSQGSRTTMEALQAGALDFVAKPSSREELPTIGALAAEKVLQLGERGRLALTTPHGRVTAAMPALPARPLVVVGSSTGGPRALFSVIPRLPAKFPAPVLVVQHMPPGFTKPLADRLNDAGPLPAREADNGELLRAGEVRVAAAGHHLLVDGERLRFSDAAPENGVRPAVDVTLRSAAANHRGPVVAAILTGMGRDGAAGAREVRARGGRVIVESERTALIYGMPRAVVEQGDADEVRDLGEIADAIVAACAEVGHAG